MATLGNLFVKLGADTSDLKRAESSFSRFASSIKSQGLGITVTLAAMTYSLKKMADAYIEDERTARKLASAMKVTGNYSVENYKQMMDLAKSLSMVSTYTDDAITSAMQLAQSMGLSVNATKWATKAAMDLATAFRMDLDQAMRMVGQGLSGNIEMLGRYIPQLKRGRIALDENATATEKVGYFMKIMNEQFSGMAQKDLGSYGGKLQWLMNRFDEAKKAVGKSIVEAVIGDPVQAMERMKQLAIYISDSCRFIAKTILVVEKAWEGWFSVWDALKLGFNKLMQSITQTNIQSQKVFAQQAKQAGNLDEYRQHLQDLLAFQQRLVDLQEEELGLRDKLTSKSENWEELKKGFAEIDKEFNGLNEDIKNMSDILPDIPKKFSIAVDEIDKQAKKLAEAMLTIRNKVEKERYEFTIATEKELSKKIEEMEAENYVKFLMLLGREQETVIANSNFKIRQAQKEHEELVNLIYEKAKDSVSAHEMELQADKKYALEVEKINQDMYEEIASNMRDYYKKFGSYLQGMAAGWNDYWDMVRTEGEQGAEMMVEVLDGLKDLMSESLFSSILEEPIDFKKKLEDFRNRILKVWTDQEADDIMKMIKNIIENSDWLRGLGLGEFLQAIENSKKTPVLLELEKQTALLNQIALNILGTAGNVAVTGQEQQQQSGNMQNMMSMIKMIWGAYQGYQGGGGWSGAATGAMGAMGGGSQSGGMGSIMSMFGNTSQSGGSGVSQFGGGNSMTSIFNMFGQGGGGQGAVGGTAASGGMSGMGAASIGGNAGMYTGMLGQAYSLYGLYTMSGSDYRNQYAAEARRTKTESGQTRYSGMVQGGIQGAMYGSSFGGVGAGVGAIYGAVMGFKAGEKAEWMDKQIKRYKAYMKDLDKLMTSEYSSLTTMSQNFGVMTKQSFANAAIFIGGAEGALIPFVHTMTASLRSMEEWGSKIGGLGAASGLDVFKSQIASFYFTINQESPEAAQKIAELREKMKQTFAKEMIDMLQSGAMSLRNVWKEMKDMDMDDAAMMAQMYEAALKSLFDSTIPLGTVQLERLYEDLKKLKDEMLKTEEIQSGWEILLKMMINGLKLTGEEIAILRGNADNLAKLKWIDVYHAMGIDKMEFSTKVIADWDDAVEEMRKSMDSAINVAVQFEQTIQQMPDALGDTKKELLAVAAALKYFANIGKEIIDLIDDLHDLPELMEDMNKAAAAGDLGAYMDDINTLVSYLTDMIEVVSMLNGVMGGEIEILNLLEDALVAVASAFQLFYVIVNINRLLGEFIGFLFDALDAEEKAASGMDDWIAKKKEFYDNVIVPIAELIRLIPIVGELLANAFLIDWTKILNLDDATEKAYKDVEDMYAKLTALTEDTFIEMTVTIAEFIRDFGKFGLEVDLSNMRDEWERYFAWMRENWQRMIDEQTFGPNTEAILKEMMENAVAYYREMIEDMFDEFVKQFTDFAQQIREDIQSMTKTGEFRGGIEQRGRTAADIMADEEETRAKMRKDISEGDWESWLEHAGELRNELLERYDLEEQRLQDIIGWITQLKDFQHTLKLDMQNLSKEGRTTADIEADMAEKRKILMSDMNGDWGTWIDEANNLRDLILERYETEKKKIEDIKNAYTSLLESVRSQILQIKTGGTNQRDIYERMATQYGEVERLRGLASGATGAERAGYLGQLAEALGSYLTMAEQAYTRPSSAYQAIYNAVIKELQAIQDEAETKISLADQQLIDLQTETVAALTELNQWATNLGVTLEEMKRVQEEKLEAIRALLVTLGGGVELVTTWIKGIENSYLNDLASLANIAATATNTGIACSHLSGIYNILWSRLPRATSHQSGLGQVPYTGYVASLHKGETILPAGTPVSINLGGISVNVQGGSGVDGKTIARQLEQEVRYGRLGMVIKDTMKKVA